MRHLLSWSGRYSGEENERECPDDEKMANAWPGIDLAAWAVYLLVTLWRYFVKGVDYEPAVAQEEIPGRVQSVWC